MSVLQLFLADEDATVALGQSIQQCTEAGDVIYLEGDLGAGKTTFVRGYLRANAYEGAVKSPTYTLVESYQLANAEIHHFDLYRISDPEELEYLGLDEYFNRHAVCLVEWPARGKGVLPTPTLCLKLSREGNGRRAEIMVNEKAAQKLDFLLKSTQYLTL